MTGQFEAFFDEAEPRLRRAFVAAYGHERGREAAAEALAYGWEHWDRVRTFANPIGYLYRVGQSRTRPRRRPSVAMAREHRDAPLVEPALAAALQRLSERQRVAVVLVHGLGWQLREVGELMGVAVTTVQKHVERGLAKLRADLEVDDGA